MTTCTRTKIGMLGAAAAVLLLLETTASAQDNCQKVKATFTDVYNGGCCTYGTITQGGFLNGTTITAYNSAAFPTPDPATASFTANLTITTVHGQLKVSGVYLYNFPTGHGTTI